MKLVLENQFFNAFRLGGIVNHTIDLITLKYELFVYSHGSLSQKRKFLNEGIVHLKEKLKSFDESILWQSHSPLFQEIRENLDSCTTKKEKERYLFSLITEFRQLSEIIYPDIVFKNWSDEEIIELKNDKEFWLSSGDERAKDQIDAINNRENELEKTKEKRIVISKKLFELTRPRKDEPETDDNLIERLFSKFQRLMFCFANQIDALCLENNIDMLKLQSECGIWLKRRRCITDVEYYIGSVELAKKYIDELTIEKDDSKINSSEKVNFKLPCLEECFVDKGYWSKLLKDPRIQDLYEQIGVNKLKWIGLKGELAGLAWRLQNKGKLISSIKSGQDLARIFCPYFEMKYQKDDREFRPGRAYTSKFNWIN